MEQCLAAHPPPRFCFNVAGWLHTNLSGCASGLPHYGGVWFSQQRLSKVRLLLQHLTRLVHPTAADGGGEHGSHGKLTTVVSAL